jgi:hypothetical protein
MTNSASNPGIVIDSDELLPREVNCVWRAYYRDIVSGVVATLLIAAIAIFGFSYMVLDLFLRLRHSTLIALIIGLTLGLCAVSYGLAGAVSEYRLLRRDLTSACCQIVRVSSTYVLYVYLPYKYHTFNALAFDCGDHTLLLVGEWWKPKRGRPDIAWHPASAQKSFPNSNFSIRRLPLSGRVLSVEVDGTKLKAKREKPVEPVIELDVPNFMDSYYVEKKLADITLKHLVESKFFSTILEDMNYPILAFTPNGVMLCSNYSNLKQCMASEYKSGWYNNLEVIDASGNSALIGSARPTGSLFIAMLLGRMITVEFTAVSSLGTQSLEAVRSRVLEFLSVYPGMYQSAGVFEEVERRVKSASQISDIISALKL